MKTTFTLQLRRFPVAVADPINGSVYEGTVVLTKEHLRAAQLVGQSSKELIARLCEDENCKVTEIGKPERLEVTLDLDKLFREGLME